MEDGSSKPGICDSLRLAMGHQAGHFWLSGLCSRHVVQVSIRPDWLRALQQLDCTAADVRPTAAGRKEFKRRQMQFPVRLVRIKPPPPGTLLSRSAPFV